MVAVDSLDRSILAVLRDSARAPFVEIASKVGVTERTVRTRMKRLEEEGVVRGYTIRSWYRFDRFSSYQGRTRNRDCRSLAGEFAGWDGVECVYEISGDADLIGIVHVDDTVALRDLLDRVWLTAPGDITSTQTELVLEQMINIRKCVISIRFLKWALNNSSELRQLRPLTRYFAQPFVANASH